MANWGGPTRLALRVGHSNGSFISQVAGPNPTRRISEDMARSFEEKLALPKGFLDADNKAPQTLPGQLPPVVMTPVVIPNLLAHVTKAVLVAVENMDVGDRPPIDKVGDIVELAYQHGVALGQVDEEYVRALVGLSRQNGRYVRSVTKP